MVSAPANVRRHFLPWDRPLLPQAVAWLAEGWETSRPLDLSRLLVVVPTRQSGRRLREALALHAAAKKQAVFPPRVVTPDRLIAAEPGNGTASPLESLLAWTEVLLELDLAAFREVFPVDPPERNFTWAMRLARDFSRLQGALAESGLRLEDVPGQAGENFPEAARWREIGELGRRQAQKLAELDLRDAQAVRVGRATAPVLSDDVTRVVVLGVPDPLPLALRALAVLARTVSVEVVIFAPAADTAAFDGWGRPLPDAWQSREFVLPEFEQRVWICADPAEQAERIVAVARGYDQSEGEVLGVGVADAEVLPLLETGFRHAGLAGFNPEGRSRRGDALHPLLAALAGLAQEDSFAAVATLGRCPDFLEFLGRRAGEGFSPARFLAELDALHARALPPDLREARRQAPGNVGLAAMAELRVLLTRGSFPANAAAALGEIFATRKFDLGQPVDALAAEAAKTWSEVMGEIAGVTGRFPGVTNAEWWEVALRLYGEGVRSDEKPPGAVELQGWLELLWEDAPHLVVAGLNDGAVPDAVVGDPFLPEALRERLGLKTNAARFARDAYLLQALAASRAAGGRLDLLVGKSSVAGDPLRPSRLLLRCADAELPRRIKFLFRPLESARPSPPWRRAWPLALPRVPAPPRLAVTALRRWLDCPLRFYLSSVLRMEAIDPAKNELDERDFGTLCHAALEAMGLEPALRDCREAPVLREFLLGKLEATVAKRFGRELTLPLLVQVESARQRLSRAADVQAETRADGWVIEAIERKFEIAIGELTVVAKVDRIDRHERTGARRVLDYKTSDTPVQPRDAHLRSLRRDETAPAFARFSGGPREQVWKDLQLPVYLRAVAVEFPGVTACGYFNLPKASTETAIVPWEDYTPELAESAWRCAEGVAAAIRAGEFGPPNENVRPEWDEFAALFQQGVAASVRWPEVVP